MTMTSRLLLALLVLPVSGCQLLSYQEPTEGPMATVEFTSNEIAAQPVVCVPGKGFKPTALSVSANTSDSQFAKDMNEALKKSPKVSVQVDASRGNVQVGYVVQQKQSTGLRKRCKVAARFSVSAGHTYTAHLTESDGHCGLEISEAGAPLADAVIAPWKCQ